MELYANYRFGAAPYLKKNWPLLQENINFRFTSLRTDIETTDTPINYNCVAWAVGVCDLWIDIDYIIEYFELDPGAIKSTVEGYSEVFKYYGFEVCQNNSIEEGFEKIVLYQDEVGDFSHVAKQLPHGRWTSKLGGWEDIEHQNEFILEGDYYGRPLIYMRRPI